MNIKEERICRLCLKVAKQEFGEIDQLVRQIFDVLMLKLDLDISSQDPIICQDCIEVAKKCLHFKSTCIDTEHFILSRFAERKIAQCKIKVLYRDREHLVTENDKDLDICRFCLTRLEKDTFVPLAALLVETEYKMLIKYLPELDFNIIKDPIICTTCRDHLDRYRKFVLNCVTMEPKLKTYCKEELEYPDNCPLISTIKEESEMLKLKDLLKLEEFHIKEEINLEEDSYIILSEARLGNNDDMSPLKDNVKETKSDIISLETIKSNTEEYIYQETIPAKTTDVNSICEDIPEVKSSESSHDERKLSANFNSEIRINNGDSKASIYKHTIYRSEAENMKICEGDAGSKNKSRVNRHSSHVIHKGSSDLQTNVADHKIVSKLKIFKCSLCSYKCKVKYVLNRHMLIHKDTSEIKMYKCSFCAYEAKRKDDLKMHTLVHKDVSEIKMFDCSFCAFKTRRKNYMNRHMLIHKDVSEIKMYKCSFCAYESKRKADLKMHMLVHKDVSEIKMFDCSLCAFKTRSKSYIERHMLIHKNVSEIRMYKCPLCAYEGKRKTNLNGHMLVHKDVSERNMFDCSLCAFKTGRKSYIKRHMLIHNDVSEIKMYKCPLCAYESKRKTNLNRHMLVHKDVSEIKMFKCSLCAYQCKRKADLKSHIMYIHKDISEIRMYKCSLCSYEAKQKHRLKRHMLIHKDITEII